MKTLVVLMVVFAANVVAGFAAYMAWLLGYMSSGTALQWLGVGVWFGVATGVVTVTLSTAILIRSWND